MNPAELPLRDLHLPDPSGWWPLAPGWWFVIALGLAGVAWLARAWWRARSREAARRRALRALDASVAAYASHGDAQRLAAELSRLLRRTMLAYAPRSEVAGLTGEAWLAWLDRGLAEPAFAGGAGRSLVSWPYRRPGAAGGEEEAKALIAAVRDRIATPLPEAA